MQGQAEIVMPTETTADNSMNQPQPMWEVGTRIVSGSYGMAGSVTRYGVVISEDEAVSVANQASIDALRMRNPEGAFVRFDNGVVQYVSNDGLHGAPECGNCGRWAEPNDYLCSVCRVS